MPANTTRRSSNTVAAPHAERRALPPLHCERLRALALHPDEHPRRQPHLSAASGLVCTMGRVYVIADDEHHLGVFADLRSPGRLHRLLPGDLPADAAARKKRKADFETLALLPPGVAGRRAALLALGSGSAPRRDGAVLIALDAAGGLAGAVRRWDLAPLYRALRERAGAPINIEGAVVVGEELVLFNRGGSGARGANALVRCALQPLLHDAGGGGVHRRASAEPFAKAVAPSGSFPSAVSLPSLFPSFTWQPCELGAVRGVGYGFTDAAALANGSFLFTAVAEDSADSVADGACVGSAIGLLSVAGEVQWMRPLAGSPKVEGIAVNETATGIEVCLVTDADDPLQASQLLRLQLPRL